MKKTISRALLAAAVTAVLPAYAAAKDVKLWSFLDPAGEGTRSEALKDVIGTFEARMRTFSGHERRRMGPDRAVADAGGAGRRDAGRRHGLLA